MSPRPTFSIVRRLTALTVVVSVLALVLNGLLIFVAIRPLFEDVADSLAAQIIALRSTLRDASPARRAQQAQSLSLSGAQFHREDSRLVRRPSGQHIALPHDPFLDRLHGALGPGIDLSLIHGSAQEPKLQLQAAFDIDGERWVMDFPDSHTSSGEPLWSLLVALAFAGLVPLLAMVMGIRLITKPMARVAREVADRYDRLRPLDAGQSVGSELQEIIVSFNGLVHAVNASNEARRHMLAGVSHDLRTPIARLRLRSELECSPETARAMEADCDALGRIVGQFLAYAQGEAGVSLGVCEPVVDLVRHIGSLYEEQGVRIEIENEPASRAEYPDLAISRIVTNLIDNAIAHGKAPITVSVGVDDAECRLVVRDAGAGIAAADWPNAFEPFVKLRQQRGTATDVGHCGLGLAIVAQICGELHGHPFHLPYDGSTSGVGVALPRYRPKAEAAGEAPAPGPCGTRLTVGPAAWI